MPRPKGSKNKKTIKKSFFKRIFGKYYLNNEDMFIQDLTKMYIKYKAINEPEFAGAFKILLNKFTNIE